MYFPQSVAQYAVAGIRDSDLMNLDHSFGKRLPEEFREFLKRSDGLSLGGGLLIYGSAELKERNETWEVEDYAPGYIAIGDDGGGNVFLMKLNQDDSAIYTVESGVMDPEFAEMVSESLNAWVAGGLAID
jgi:hypothetical protein